MIKSVCALSLSRTRCIGQKVVIAGNVAMLLNDLCKIEGKALDHTAIGTVLQRIDHHILHRIVTRMIVKELKKGRKAASPEVITEAGARGQNASAMRAGLQKRKLVCRKAFCT